MNTIIAICARAGSKGVPGKNYKELGGKPLIEYTARQAERFAEAIGADIILSTDSPEVKAAVTSYEKVDQTYIRPEELSGSNVSKIKTIWEAVKYKEEKTGKEYDVIIDLDVVAPLRTNDELIDCFNTLIKNEQALNIFSVSHADKNPYFNMIEMDEKTGFGHIPCGDGRVISRQTAPTVYALNGSFYMYKRPFFKESQVTPFSERTLPYLVNHVCFDIDETIDFEWLEFLFEKGELDEYLY